VTAQPTAEGALQTVLGAIAVAFSLLVAISAGLLEITKPGQRWRLYQRLRYDLEGLGWRLARGGQLSETNDDVRFQRFVKETERLLERYASDYFSEIAQVAAADRDQAPEPRIPSQRSSGDGLTELSQRDEDQLPHTV
jgi:hypothetical protein